MNKQNDMEKNNRNDKPNESKDTSFGIHELLLLLFYLIIVAIGVTLVLRHGENAGIGHMAGVALCLCGITTVKFAKYRGELKEHAAEMIFSVVLFACSLFALFAHLL